MSNLQDKMSLKNIFHWNLYALCKKILEETWKIRARKVEKISRTVLTNGVLQSSNGISPYSDRSTFNWDAISCGTCAVFCRDGASGVPD